MSRGNLNILDSQQLENIVLNIANNYSRDSIERIVRANNSYLQSYFIEWISFPHLKINDIKSMVKQIKSKSKFQIVYSCEKLNFSKPTSEPWWRVTY